MASRGLAFLGCWIVIYIYIHPDGRVHKQHIVLQFCKQDSPFDIMQTSSLRQALRTGLQSTRPTINRQVRQSGQPLRWMSGESGPGHSQQWTSQRVMKSLGNFSMGVVGCVSCCYSPQILARRGCRRAFWLDLACLP